jgi:hypothetical protein
MTHPGMSDAVPPEGYIFLVAADATAHLTAEDDDMPIPLCGERVDQRMEAQGVTRSVTPCARCMLIATEGSSRAG